MKQSKLKWISALLAFVSCYISACSSVGGVQGGAVNTDSLVQAQSFEFIPQTVTPMAGRTRQLNAGFALTISPDTVQSYLPYFGRAYTAPITAGRGAMDFVLTQFDYNAQQQDGRRNISIRPREGGDIRELQLQVFSNGSAQLQAFSNNRQNISYNGYIKPRGRR